MWNFKRQILLQIAHVSLDTKAIAILCVNLFLTLSSLSGTFYICLNKIFIKLVHDFSSLCMIYCLCPMRDKDISLMQLPSPTHVFLSPHRAKSCYNFWLN